MQNEDGLMIDSMIESTIYVIDSVFYTIDLLFSTIGSPVFGGRLKLGS